MKLYGSLTNRMSESATKGQPIPTVGMGMTSFGWSDRHAGTIRKVSPCKKKLWFTMDEAKRTDRNGQSESQSYTFRTKDEIPEEQWHLATLRKDGAWHEGTTMSGSTIAIGYRSEYYDPSF